MVLVRQVCKFLFTVNYFALQRYVAQWLFGNREKSLAELNLEASLAMQKSLLSLVASVEKLQSTLDNHCAKLQTLINGSSGFGVDGDWRKEIYQIRDEVKSVKGIMLGT